MQKLISIIIPVYNAEAYLAENIDSILNQTYKRFELILVDDGSTDKSAQIMKNYSEREPRIVALYQENSGAPTARNYGLSVAQGDYIQFIDSDDLMAKQALIKMVTALEETGSDLVIGAYDTVDDKDAFIKLVPHPISSGSYSVQENRETFSLIPPMPGNKLFRASVIRDNNLRFQPSLRQAQDLNFYLKFLFFAEKIVVLDEVVYHYRVRTGSISHTYSLVILEVIRSINDAADFYSAHGKINKDLFMNIKFHHYTFQIQKIPQISAYQNRLIALESFKNEFKQIEKTSLIKNYSGIKYYVTILKLVFGKLYISKYYKKIQDYKANRN